jgi:hypothetical protein
LGGGEVIRIKRQSGLMKQKIALKTKKIKINGKLNNIGSADENK